MRTGRGRGRKQILKELRELLTMDRFGCGEPGTGFTAVYRGRVYTSPTALVRDATRLWRHTWVFPLIDELIEKEKP